MILEGKGMELAVITLATNCGTTMIEVWERE